jgi:hypothetical protein
MITSHSIAENRLYENSPVEACERLVVGGADDFAPVGGGEGDRTQHRTAFSGRTIRPAGTDRR